MNYIIMALMLAAVAGMTIILALLVDDPEKTIGPGVKLAFQRYDDKGPYKPSEGIPGSNEGQSSAQALEGLKKALKSVFGQWLVRGRK